MYFLTERVSINKSLSLVFTIFPQMGVSKERKPHANIRIRSIPLYRHPAKHAFSLTDFCIDLPAHFLLD